MKTELLFVRHGETISNIRGVLHGRTDVPLTENGIRQARLVAERLAGLGGIHHLYTSPLLRARVTADTIAQRIALAPRLHDGLRELDFGDLEGCTPQELAERYPALFARLNDLQDPDVAFPNGESRREFHERVERTIRHLVSTHRGERVIVVAHGGVIASGIAQLTGGEPNDWLRYHVLNCSVTHVEVDGDAQASLHCLNDVSHLDSQVGAS